MFGVLLVFSFISVPTATEGIEPGLELFDQTNLPLKTRLGFDKIYVINLERRPNRRQRMQWCFDVLGIEAEFIEAVDGRKISDEYLEKHGIETISKCLIDDGLDKILMR